MIPHELDFKTHLLEYQPGTYGDFVCAIISYSIDDFFDPQDPKHSANEKYWKVADDTIMLRNKYPLSLRGNGYEHIENYTEFLLAHKFYNDYQDYVYTNKKQVLFNTHRKLNSSETLLSDSRVIKNSFDKTQTKALTVSNDFDTILMCSCNEYFTSVDHKKINWDHLLHVFKVKVREVNWTNDNIETDKLLDIKNILDFNPEIISVYGDVNEKKFNRYYREYKDKKLDLLRNLTKQCLTEIFSNPKLRHNFIKAYETK